MPEHEFLTGYQAKAVEYLVAVAYLLLFVPFWRFVTASRPAAVAARVAERRPAGWFALPDGIHLHPGHAWLKTNGGEVVTVGLDDFAQKLVGPISRVELPAAGAMLAQGERGFRLIADSKPLDVLAPLDGTVVAVNQDLAAEPRGLAEDPYGRGWLLKVRAAHLDSDLKQLLAGELARKWMEGVTDTLRSRMSPELGHVLQDGGQPVHGIARELEPERWDEMARAYLLS